MTTSVTRLGPVEGHRRWALSYDEAPNPLVALEQRLLLPFLAPFENQRVLDVACGTGRWMQIAQERGAVVSGLDITPRILDEATRKPGLGGRMALGDAVRLPFASDAFDLLLCAFALGYLEDREESIQQLARVVKPGGCVAVSDLHPEALEAGWTSSFRQAGTVYEVARRRYPLEEIRALGRRSGLREEKLIEARFDEPERPLFRQAGKTAQFEELRNVPAVFALVWRREV